MEPYVVALIAVLGTLLGALVGYLLQRRQAREQRSWQKADLQRQEALVLVQSTSEAFDQREAMLWQERRALYIRYLGLIDDWIRVLRDLRDSGGFAAGDGAPIRTSEEAHQASPLAAASMDASTAFAKGDVEVAVLAGIPVLSVLGDLRSKLYEAASAALTGDDKLGEVAEQRGRLVQAMRFELTTSFVGDRHAQHASQ